MKSYKKELWFNAPERVAFINITEKVEDALEESGIGEGLCLINAMHITASVFINDNERGLHEDYKRWLEELAPHEPISRYLHNRTGEDNGDAARATIEKLKQDWEEMNKKYTLEDKKHSENVRHNKATEVIDKKKAMQKPAKATK